MSARQCRSERRRRINPHWSRSVELSVLGARVATHIAVLNRSQLVGKCTASCDHDFGSDAECREFLAFPGRTGSSSIAFDCNEPMHVHVRRDRQQAKFWLAPVALAWNDGFSSRELNEIRRLVVAHEAAIIEAWHEHCGQR